MERTIYKLIALLTGCFFYKVALAVEIPDVFINLRQGDYYSAIKELPALKKSNKSADYYLAWMSWFGYGVNRDIMDSISKMRSIAAYGNRDAERWLANYYLANQQFPEALKWYQVLANQGDLLARKYTSAAYYFGIGTKINLTIAKKYADKGFFNYLAEISVDSSNPELNNIQYFKQAITGDKSNNNFYGTSFYFAGNLNDWTIKEDLNGQHVPFPMMAKISPDLLFKPKHRLIQPSELDLTVYLSSLMPMVLKTQNRLFVYPQYPLNRHIQALLNSRSFVLKHEEWNSVIDDGCHLDLPIENKKTDLFEDLMHINESNWALKMNYKSVISYLYSRAILGDADAQFQIAQLFDQGIGVAKNPDNAKTYYELAATQQDIRAVYNLGLLYLGDSIKPKNYIKGVELLQDAAFKGNVYAQYVSAILYKEGLNDNDGYPIVDVDLKQSIAMLYLASANHFSEAQYQLANLLIEKGPQNIISANSREHQKKLIKELYFNAYLGGIPEAQMPLAFFNLDSKIETEKQASVKIIKELGEQQNMLANVLWALILDRGITVPVNHEAAVEIFEQYPDNVVSKFAIAMYNWNGNLFKQNKERALNLLHEIAEEGFSDAYYNLAIINQNNGEKFMDYLNKALKQGNYHAGILLADNQFAMSNYKTLDDNSLNLYKQFAEQGDENAQTKLGFIYQHGILGHGPNWSESIKYYNKAAKQNYPEALYMLGLFEQSGIVKGVADINLAVKYYKKSANAGYAPALIALGFLSETYFGQYQEALQYYELAIKNAKNIYYASFANYNLGLMYELGKGVTFDDSQAFKYYVKAVTLPISQREMPAAMTRLGNLYYKVQKDYDRALLWLQKAADYGDPDANYQLGKFYEQGTLVKQDLDKAAEYYKKATILGYEQTNVANVNRF